MKFILLAMIHPPSPTTCGYVLRLTRRGLSGLNLGHQSLGHASWHVRIIIPDKDALLRFIVADHETLVLRINVTVTLILKRWGGGLLNKEREGAVVVESVTSTQPIRTRYLGVIRLVISQSGTSISLLGISLGVGAVGDLIIRNGNIHPIDLDPLDPCDSPPLDDGGGGTVLLRIPDNLIPTSDRCLTVTCTAGDIE
eukprot:sb/3470853/